MLCNVGLGIYCAPTFTPNVFSVSFLEYTMNNGVD